jgi:hypothetical protein
VKAFLDGKLVKEFKTTSYEEMSVNPLFKIRSTSILGLGSWYSSVSYDRIEVVEITGKGKPTR